MREISLPLDFVTALARKWLFGAGIRAILWVWGTVTREIEERATDIPEPLTQLADLLGMPWWLFAVVSQSLVVVAPFVGLWLLRRWQSGTAEGKPWQRWRPLPEQAVLVLLPAAAGLFIAACGLYCLAWWPKPPEPRILEPDAAILCWLYCGVFMTWLWAAATMVNGLALLAAGALIGRSETQRLGGRLALIAGLIAFPLGVLGVYSGLRTLRRPALGQPRTPLGVQS